MTPIRITIDAANEDGSRCVRECTDDGAALIYMLIAQAQDGCVRIVSRTTVSGHIRSHVAALRVFRLRLATERSRRVREELELPHDP